MYCGHVSIKRAVERRKQQEEFHTQEVQYKTLDKKGESLHRLHDMESLANALSETVKEKNISLDLQRKTNRYCHNIYNLIVTWFLRALAAKITELEQKLYSLELAHVTDTVKKQCEFQPSNCCETYPDNCREDDQLIDAFQVLNHHDTNDVV